jgi:PKD domain
MHRRSIVGRTGWPHLAKGVLVAAAFACCFASTASAHIVFDKRTGLKLSILRPPLAPSAASNRTQSRKVGYNGPPTCDNVTPVDSNCAHPLAYHNGPVQHAENDYLFFWGPSGFTTSSYVTGMQQWLNDLAGGDYTTGAAAPVGNPVSVAQEYYDLSGPGKTKRFVSYDVANAGTIVDNNAYPTNGCTDKYTDWFNSNTVVTLAHCLTQAQLYTELSHYIAAHHLPTGLSTQYFILTPTNVGSCADSTNKSCAIASYCAWHSIGGTVAAPIVYAYQPWLQGTTCDVNRVNTFTNIYSSGIDSVVGTFSHELSETMTDPALTGWYSDTFDEIGDKCAYQYDVGYQPFETWTGLPTLSGTPYNVNLGTNHYLLQEEYDNRNGGCNQWDTDVQPSGTTVNVPAGSVTTGTAATFSVSNVVTTGNIGVAYVKWLFGDGSTATSVGTAAISRYYQAPGSYSATAIVTDNHGNEVKVPAASSVSVIAPTTPQLQAAANAVIKPAGAGAKIGSLLHNGGYTFTFSTLAKGTFNEVWKHGSTVVATITKALSILGPNRLKIALTSAGHNLLANHSTLSIASSDSFSAPSVPPAVHDAASFTLTH